MNSITSIVSTQPGTVIYYDQWEDGYENDIGSPLSIYNASTNPYDQSGGIPAQWTDTGNSTLDDVGNVIVEPCQGLFTHPRAAAGDIVSVGVVRSWDFASPLAAPLVLLFTIPARVTSGGGHKPGTAFLFGALCSSILFRRERRR